MSRQDQVIDDDEPDTCPLCIEELDISDRNFRPCPCGYQVCQFCYNNIKTTMNGLCPACRRPYDDKNIKFDAPSAEEVARYKENQANREKKAKAAKKQEVATRQADPSSRKHLAGIRVRRQNLVYVTGLRLNTSDPQLGEKLRGDNFFGQYGKIDKIVVNRPKDSRALQPVGVYITYFDKDAANLCISMVNGSQNAGGTIRADYGTTKYCSAFLRHETCTNKNCTFLHEVGDEEESFTREGLSSLNASQADEASSSQPAQRLHEQQPPQPHHFPAISESMDRQEIREEHVNNAEPSTRPALPSTASWAKPGGALSRRASQSRSSAAASPMVSAVAPLQPPQASTPAPVPAPAPVEPPPAEDTQPPPQPAAAEVPSVSDHRFDMSLDYIKRVLTGKELSFESDFSDLNGKDLQMMNTIPPMFDPNGGAKRLLAAKHEADERRLIKDREIATQALSGMQAEDGTGGSLQLGGEPDEHHDGEGSRQQTLPVGPSNDLMSPNFSIAYALSPEPQARTLGRSSGPQAQFPHQHLKSPSPGYPTQTSGRNSIPPTSTFPGGTHARQNSRFSFANESASGSSVKASSNPKFTNPASSLLPPSSQYSSPGNQYFSSGVQGPPPGLKATGTPPVSGGGMFGQGHGFATAGLGYGANSSGPNQEMMRQLLERNRGGSAGSGQTSEGGRLDLADPGILQSRMHQAGSGGNNHYGSQAQGQGGFNSTMYGNGGYGGRW